MNASPFRSHLMQTFAVSARAQSRPPIALFSLGGGGGGGGERANVPPAALPSPSASSSSRHHPRPRGSSSVASRSLPAGGGDSRDAHVCPSEDVVHHEPPPPPSPPPPPPTSAEALRRLIVSRRTVSNFAVRPPSLASSDAEYLRGAISRGVACAASAPNHKVTEPSTFRRILAPSAASERLLVIAHEVTLRRLLDGKLSGEGACRSEAARKREKWATVPAFVVATVGGMDDQVSSGGAEYDPYGELPHVPPSTIAQLEDHASTCASVQNLLLSLHAEGLGCKWATGPVIRTRSFRDLIDCRRDEMVVALIMVGWAKRLPTSSRRRFRELEGDVLRDVDYDARRGMLPREM